MAWNSIRNLSVYSLFIFAFSTSSVFADDWPMWRYDAQRTSASPNELPDAFHLLWTRKFTPRTQAWDDPLNLDLMTYDRVFEPIVMDGRLFVGFNDRDKLMALDAETGKELWSCYAEAPVRLPPAGSNGRIYFCSDDGYLYCVSADNGRLLWKFDGAPNAQHAIGNRRFTSAWPARGGPVVRDGTVYFAASIWPFMGTFIYAIDAASGELRWVNDNTGSQYIKQPHSAPSFAGVAPQGALVATESLLVVPGGRSVPAVFDRADGKLRYFELNAGGKGTGGSFVSADDKHFYVHTRRKGTRAFHLHNGVKTAFMPNQPVLHRGRVYSAETQNDKPVVRAYGSDNTLAWEIDADGSGDLVLAGEHLVAAGDKAIVIIAMPDGNKPASIVKTIPVERGIERLIVADQKLFAVTMDGHISAMGGQQSHGEVTGDPRDIIVPANDERQDAAELLAAGDASGYALWFGSCFSQRARALAVKSPFEQLAMIDPSKANVDHIRPLLDGTGVYGSVTVHHSDASAFRAPKYVANMVFVDEADQQDAVTVAKIYESVRPYGGVMHLLTYQDRQQLAATVRAMNLEQAKVEIGKHGVIVRREGALPGAADWTHQHGDIANSIKSNDRRVKLPLGVLWFGGSSNLDVLPRHGHGPPEQVVGGRLFIQGMNCLSARDVYTGRVLWKRDFENLGTLDIYYDTTYEDTPLDPKYNQVHIPGANARGTNYVVTHDRVYIVDGNVCHALDPATGATLKDFQLPADKDGEPESWGFIGVYQDVLIGGLGFAMYRGRYGLDFPEDKKLKPTKAGFGAKSLDRAASVALVGFDRHSGKQLWKVDANHSFWHNGIVAGGGKIYCLDKNPAKIEEAMRRRGNAIPQGYRILAFDYQTGKQNWQINENIFGTWLGYSEQHDLLLQAGAKGSDRLTDETASGMAVYAGSDGSLQWKNDSLAYAGPCILHNDLIITNANSNSASAGAFYLKTGKRKLVQNPLTGQSQPWKIERAYGCNNIIASENLLTFRSGAAGFYDLLTDAGTGNLGGFKSGCTSNLVVANGVLNAPDYTRTCSCAYQNQTSLALIHMPDVETWSISNVAASSTSGQPIRQLGVNFGAAGDRRDAEGMLWLEHPVVAGASPPLSIRLNSDAKFFQFHASTMSGADRPWIQSSGVEGVTDIRVGMNLLGDPDLSKGIIIDHADDDAEENEDGKVNLTSSKLEFVEDSGTQVVGMRFNRIKLDRNAVVRRAFIQFVCDQPSSEATTLIIAAEDTDNAARFNAERHDLSSRSLTSKEVGWEPPPWTKIGEAGEAQRTPDLAPLVQSVIKRPNWKPGNSIALLINGSGKRNAASSKGGAKKAPRLFIETDPRSSKGKPTQAAKKFDVRLFFAAPPQLAGGSRVFDVYAQEQLVAKNVSIDSSGDPDESCVMRLIRGVTVATELHLQLVAKKGKPVVSGIEIVQADEPKERL